MRRPPGSEARCDLKGVEGGVCEMGVPTRPPAGWEACAPSLPARALRHPALSERHSGSRGTATSHLSLVSGGKKKVSAQAPRVGGPHTDR